MQIPTMTFVIAVVMIGLGSVQSTADVTIEVEPPTPLVSLLPLSCKVEICCRPTHIVAWHCFTKCTETFPNGDTRVTACRGSPTGLGQNEWPPGVPSKPNVKPVCPPWSVLDGAWGPVDTYCGPLEEGHPDFAETEAPQPICREVVTTGWAAVPAIALQMSCAALKRAA